MCGRRGIIINMEHEFFGSSLAGVRTVTKQQRRDKKEGPWRGRSCVMGEVDGIRTGPRPQTRPQGRKDSEVAS